MVEHSITRGDIFMKNGMIWCSSIAPINIAISKYWGKRNESLIIPTHNSISLTVDKSAIYTKTTIFTSENIKKDSMQLKTGSGDYKSIEISPRIRKIIEIMRGRKGEVKVWNLDENIWVDVNMPDVVNGGITIFTMNTFPISSGMASSASGIAALSLALSTLWGVKQLFYGEFTTIARQGSGSACRSLLGGVVEWISPNKDLPVKEQSNKSMAVQLYDQNYWPELTFIVALVNNYSETKGVSSSQGQQISMETSPFINHWSETVIPKRIVNIKKAIGEKNFEQLAIESMHGSNELHSICLSSFPPLHYMTHITLYIIDIIHTINKLIGKTIIGYSVDAGCHLFMLTLEEYQSILMDLFSTILLNPKIIGASTNKIMILLKTEAPSLLKRAKDLEGGVSKLILAKLGSGVEILTPTDPDIKEALDLQFLEEFIAQAYIGDKTNG